MRDKRSGPDTLRKVVDNMNATRESFNDQYTAEQLLKIYQAQLASKWDFYPDQWTARQVKEALEGIVPRWDENERPVHG